MASNSGTLYLGVTNNLLKRTSEHREDINEGFTKKYKCHKLVYYEQYNDVKQAITREKQIKKWRREKKEVLIKNINPKWRDLYYDLVS
jgi:putative endonuclease